MSEQKRYTAQEMREMAKNICRVDAMDGLTCRENCYTMEKAVLDMLRQAADAMEREAAKDEEIGKLRECLREAVEWSCGNPDENCKDCVAHGGDTPCKCETWRKMLEGGHK